MKRDIRYVPQFTEEMKAAALRVMDSGQMIRGGVNTPSEGKTFEEEFSLWCGLDSSVNLSSGTAGLHLSLIAYGIGSGDEVITVANTFNSVADCIILVGATPVFVDICKDTFNIDVEKISSAITPRTKAIMPVHTAGLSADMDPIMELAKEHDLIVIEDACQALGARYKGRMIGTTGHVGVYSFVQNKAVCCGGEGGMVATNDLDVANRIRTLANHGRGDRWDDKSGQTYGRVVHDMVGFNYRQDEMLSAIGRVALKDVHPMNVKRRQNAQTYRSLFADRNVPIVLPTEKEWAHHSFLRYTILAPERDALREYASEHGIHAGINYPTPLHLDPPYQQFGGPEGSLPVTEEVAKTTLTIPNYPSMTDDDLRFVVDTVTEFYSE